MIFVDRLLVSGLRFVLDRVADAVDAAEREQVGALRAELLDAELRAEAGEIDEDELAEIQTSVLSRLRELVPDDDRRRAEPLEMAGVEIELGFDSPPVEPHTVKRHGRKQPKKKPAKRG